MSVPRTRDPACDLTVQPTVSTLHIPASHTFIPFQQFSISDGSGLRNPADDNNNKTGLPVVSVVTAVSGLCPAIPVVSMHQTAQLAQAVVTPTIIPAVVTPMTVQTANCLTPTTTMTVANTLNIGSHISVPVQHHTVSIAGINVSAQSVATISNSMNATAFTNNNQNTALPATLNKPAVCSNGTNNNSPPNTTNSSKPNGSNSSKPPSNQSSATEQNEDLVKPVFKDGELVLEVECGQNKAILYLSKLCQGSKGPCISFQSSWLTPNEFQFVSGRETAKDWKRSIRHHGKSLKLLLAKGILNVHPTMCDCDGCRQGATLTRKGEKRRIPNGERKPRKASITSSSVGSDGNSTGAFRLLGSSTMPAHLTPPGATQAKPEVKRSGIDKSKMADTTASSTLTDSTSKIGMKPSAVPRPNSLNTSRDCIKPTHASSSLTLTSPLLAVHVATSASPPTPGQLNYAPGQATPSRVQPYPSATVFSNSATSPASHSLLVASLATPLTAALSAPAADQPIGYATTNPGVSNTHSPSFQNSKQPCIQSSPKDCDLSESADDDSEGHSKTDQEMFHNQVKTVMSVFDDEDHAVSNDMEESQNADDKSDMLDDDDDDVCDDESSDGSSFKDSENSNCSSNEQMNDGGFDHETSFGEPHQVIEHQTDQQQQSAEISAESADVKEELDLKESAELALTSEAAVADVDNEEKYNPALPVQSALSASLAVSTFSGTYSQPLFVTVSSNNVKSEHIWVPPRLSPQSEPHHTQQTGSSAMKAADVLAAAERSGHFRPDDQTSYEQSKNSDKQDTSNKPAVQSNEFQQSKELQVQQLKELPQAIKQETQMAGPATVKEFQSIERHLTGNFEHGRSEAKGDTSHGKGTQEHNLGGSDKSNRDKEREEKYRQKLKEERNRKDREERNRKDREREERRERERREEKDAERRRQEDKERREMAKAHTEGNNSKENASMDHSRRPPGGVAEAAAFSDYMRVLAAGHAHPFMSPTLSYMSSLFPVRPQEPNIQTHLLHPMSAFGSQLSGLPKEYQVYQTPGGMVSNFGAHPFTPLHPVLQRHSYSGQQSLLDYQRSLSTATAYPWPTAYPYFMSNVSTSSSQAASSAAGMKRPATEIEAAMEMNAKRMRMEGRLPEYTSTWDYFAAAAAATQHQRAAAMASSLPCGLESASMDKTTEYLRKRYMEYGPQAAAYLSALPEYSRTPYHCACADHRDDNIVMWSVEDVYKFLSSLEGCAVYADHFREQRVTGRILALLTTDHFVKAMGMKLGPAVLLSEAVAKKVQDSTKMYSCDACRNIALSQPMHPMALPL